jgi:hypothetical protein
MKTSAIETRRASLWAAAGAPGLSPTFSLSACSATSIVPGAPGSVGFTYGPQIPGLAIAAVNKAAALLRVIDEDR